MAYSDAITQTLKMTTNEEKAFRMFDMVVIPIIFVVMGAAFHLHYMLTAGDWDFWVDWKDRLYWPIVSTISFVMVAAAVQGLLWRLIRMPIGMTLAGTSLVLMEWISRYYNFHLWAYFPMSQVWPATWIAVGLFIDTILLITGSALMTSLFGVFFLPVIFILSNYPMLAPFRIPVNVMGTEVPVADWIGYVFQRGGSPEYLRIIEDAGLRVLGGETWFISCLFGGFVAIFVYLGWWWISGIAAKPFSRSNPLAAHMGGEEPSDKDHDITADVYQSPSAATRNGN